MVGAVKGRRGEEVGLVVDLDDLKALVAAGQNEYAILLAGGRVISRKTIRRKGRRWIVDNHIDDSRQELADAQLWTESNIGEALDKVALVIMR